MSTVRTQFNFKIETHTAPSQSLQNLLLLSNINFLLDTKAPIIPTSQHKSSTYVFECVFSHFLVPVPIAQRNPLTLKQVLELFNIIGVSNWAP